VDQKKWTKQQRKKEEANKQTDKRVERKHLAARSSSQHQRAADDAISPSPARRGFVWSRLPCVARRFSQSAGVVVPIQGWIG
jgi:hypothetical protein